MTSDDFDTWFATYLGQSRTQVEQLLQDKTAVRFLIAWSLLETGCFGGFVKGKELASHCRRLVDDEGFDPAPLAEIVEHFHSRYQDSALLANLMHKHLEPSFAPLLSRPLRALSKDDALYLAVSVVYRYRNNIFHGSKGVDTWLSYKPQIEQCIKVMQSLISHAAFKAGVQDVA